eukprot:c35830_g1_i1 orf=57-209(+)
MLQCKVGDNGTTHVLMNQVTKMLGKSHLGEVKEETTPVCELLVCKLPNSK